jgi:hypothetical protein
MRHSGSSFDNFRCRIIDSLVDLFLFTIQDLLNFIIAKGEEGERWRGRRGRAMERESDGEGEEGERWRGRREGERWRGRVVRGKGRLAWLADLGSNSPSS